MAQFAPDRNPAERQRQQQRVDTFLARIRSLVTVKPREGFARRRPEQREELIVLFGEPTAAAIGEAAATGAVLWTDDIAVAEVAKELVGEKRVWTQLVFRELVGQGDLPAEPYNDLVLFLL